MPNAAVITIELGRETVRDAKGKLCCLPGNNNVFIEPLGYSRRGVYVRDEIAYYQLTDAEKRRLEGIPARLPGYRVSIEIAARRVTVYDPLKDDAEVCRVAKIEEPVVLERCTDTQLWHWLKWAKREVNGGMARVVEGRFPAFVDERLEQEREWDSAANQNTGEREWQKEPALASA